MVMDQEAFEQAKLKVLLQQHDPHGFGTLQEKTVHRAFPVKESKRYSSISTNGKAKERFGCVR